MNNENLTPFKPGQSGNPKGAPKGKHFQTLLKEAVNHLIDYNELGGGKKKMRVDKAMLMALLSKGLYKEDVTALKFLVEMIDGEANKHVQVDVGDGGLSIANRLYEQVEQHRLKKGDKGIREE